MEVRGAVISLLFLTLSSSLLGFASIPLASASIAGVVCIADVTSNSCKESPTPPPGDVGSQVEVAVNIQDSASINGFDIYVKTDPNILIPASVDFRGTALGPNHFVAALCIGQTGSGCYTFTTGPGVVRVAAVATGFATTAPTTGRLFSITYNVTSRASGQISFQTACSPSSTSGNYCVLVVLGYEIVPVTIVPDTIGPGDFAFISPPDPRIVLPRNEFQYASLTIVSVGGFSGGVGLKLELTPHKGRFSPIAFFLIDTPGVFLIPGTYTVLNMEVAALQRSPIGVYTLTVTGTSGLVSHSASFNVQVTR